MAEELQRGDGNLQDDNPSQHGMQDKGNLSYRIINKIIIKLIQ